MARANRDKVPQLTNRAQDGFGQPNKKPYKVLLESVTQEKRKLQTHVSYTERAPDGFTFVPVGVRDLTDYCKEESRKKGLEVYLVSAEPKNKASRNPENISHHVHRIGHHFDNRIVEQGTIRFGYSAHRNNTYRRNNAANLLGPTNIAQRLERQGRRMGLSHADMSDEQRSQQVRETIKELFPRIPSGDLEAIVKRAFEEGTRRVGNAEDLPIPRRVQLAVVAHIRHVYTQYDQLLKKMPYHEARAMVEQPCLDQIVKWRGEQKEDDEVIELEDIFREVIVLDDDEEESSGADDQRYGRDSSLEIVSSKVNAKDLDPGSLSRTPPNYSPEQPIMRATPATEIIHVRPKRDHASRRLLQHDEIARRYEESRARQGMLSSAGEAGASNTYRQPMILPVRGYPTHSNGQRVYYDQQPNATLPPKTRQLEYAVDTQRQDPQYVRVRDDAPGFSQRHESSQPVYVSEGPELYRGDSYATSSQFASEYPERSVVESIENKASEVEYVGQKRKPVNTVPMSHPSEDYMMVSQIPPTKRSRMEGHDPGIHYSEASQSQTRSYAIRPASSFPLQPRNKPEERFIDLTQPSPKRDRRSDHRAPDTLYERVPSPTNAVVYRADTWPSKRPQYVLPPAPDHYENAPPPNRSRRIIYVDDLPPPRNEHPIIDRQPLPAYSHNGDQFGWQPPSTSAALHRPEAYHAAPPAGLREAVRARETRNAPPPLQLPSLYSDLATHAEPTPQQQQRPPSALTLDGTTDRTARGPPPPPMPYSREVRAQRQGPPSPGLPPVQLPPPSQYDVHPSRQGRMGASRR